MIAFILLALVGGILIFFGVLNCCGNLKPLHSYHYKRVAKKDFLKFGRRVGLGNILIGVSIILYGASLYAYEKTQSDLCVLIGLVVLFVGLGAGLAISFAAMQKYNKGIF